MQFFSHSELNYIEFCIHGNWTVNTLQIDESNVNKDDVKTSQNENSYPLNKISLPSSLGFDIYSYTESLL